MIEGIYVDQWLWGLAFVHFEFDVGIRIVSAFVVCGLGLQVDVELCNVCAGALTLNLEP